MPDDMTNELTPAAEMLWKLYSQLLLAGFERQDALQLVEVSLRQLLSQLKPN